MSPPVILAVMSFCFLFFGYLGVPVPFALLGGVFVGATLADVSLAAIVQKIFDGVDAEALLAIPFFLLVGELMSSAETRRADRYKGQPVHRPRGVGQLDAILSHVVVSRLH